MQHKILKSAVFTTVLAMSHSANAQSVSFFYDYMATNLKGDFAQYGATPVAKVTFTDVAAGGTYLDALGNIQQNTDGGVKATFTLLSNGLSQFSNGKGALFVASFETNFPNTSACSNATCSSTGTINGYDTNGAGGLGNQWSQGAGASFSANGAGGVEWAENGQNNGWGIGKTDVGFGQENNWGTNSTLSFSAIAGSGIDTSSTITWYNTTGRNDISVTNLLANPVYRTTDGTANGAIDTTHPAAYSWIKIRSNATATAGDRGIATDQWWGTPQTSGSGANQRWQLNVLAVSAVPEPESYAMMLAGLGLMGFVASRRKLKA